MAQGQALEGIRVFPHNRQQWPKVGAGLNDRHFRDAGCAGASNYTGRDRDWLRADERKRSKLTVGLPDRCLPLPFQTRINQTAALQVPAFLSTTLASITCGIRKVMTQVQPKSFDC